jgi:transposase
MTHERRGLGFIRTQTNGSRTYLLLVENARIDGRLVQRVLHRFGRLDALRASGQLDTLVQSLGRFAEKIVVLDAHAKDPRPDLRQLVVGLVLDEEGRPVCSELWPGNTTDVKTLIPIVDRLQQVFHVRDVCVVADRGLISAETIAAIEDRGWFSILRVRMRSSAEAQAVVDADGPFTTVFPARKATHDVAPWQVKEVTVDDHRSVVCRNDEEARQDAHDRDAIVSALRTALAHGDKALVGNKGYRRFLKSQGARFTIDDPKVEADARDDGRWVLRTNTTLALRDVALAYTQRWMVEATFRSMKSVLDTRPIDHQRDDTMRGQVFCSFLALLLRQELERRRAANATSLEWAHIMRDLEALQETTITIDERAYVVRSEAKRTAGNVFQACGIAMPPALRSMHATESSP